MTAKEYLSGLEKIEVRIRQKMEERQELLERATSITTTFGMDKVRSSPKHDKMAYFVAKVADLEEEIALIASNLLDERNMIVNQIHELDTPSHITLLYERYVHQKKFNQIANELNYSYEYVKHLHIRALKEFAKVHAALLKAV